MFQTFEISKTSDNKRRLAELRTCIFEHNLDGFIVPHADLYQNEYIESCDSRLEWITGFTGSAGVCVVTLKDAFLFVDGRYQVQAKKEVDETSFTILHSTKISFIKWFKTNCENKIIGYDPWLHTVLEIEKLQSFHPDSQSLKACKNLIDLVWIEKPVRAELLIEVHPLKFSGASSKAKREKIVELLIVNEIDAIILTKPESICWLLNIRGKDVAHTPIIQCLAIFKQNSNLQIFIRDTNVSKKIRAFLGKDVEIINDTLFLKYISGFKSQRVQLDPNTCPMVISSTLKASSNALIETDDPCVLPKAIKNKTEIKGSKAAHLIDGSAFIKFLHWLDIKLHDAELNEIEITQKLEEFRQATGSLEEIAFDTICGFASNGAIVHYRVTKKSNKKIKKNNLLLIDSGGQYKMGTTDLTRTIAIGQPTAPMIDAFTRVLKGMIAISTLRWPSGLSGQHIDSLARSSLWSVGLDYDHGTGHGVGSYLSVHEGPHAISQRNKVPLEAGMIVSNEPGYYKASAFGIRIENILLVQNLPKKIGSLNHMLAFETLTLAPIDKALINQKILTNHEKTWLNNYHELVQRKITPIVPLDTQLWLKNVCQPI